MTTISDERALIEALQRHDENALAAVFETYSDRVYRLAVSLLADEQQADGVVQDTFIALIEHIDTFEGRSSIGTWLYRVAYNNVMGRLRRQKPQLDLDILLDEDDYMPQHMIDWTSIPETLLSNSEVMEQVAQAIEQLPPTMRAVFLLRDVEDLSTQETADTLGISAGAVKVRLHRARLMLREVLASYFEEKVM